MKRLARWVQSTSAIFAAMMLATTAMAQDPAANWPSKPVRIIVNFGPGGSADNSMRPFAATLFCLVLCHPTPARFLRIK